MYDIQSKSCEWVLQPGSLSDKCLSLHDQASVLLADGDFSPGWGVLQALTTQSQW